MWGALIRTRGKNFFEKRGDAYLGSKSHVKGQLNPILQRGMGVPHS